MKWLIASLVAAALGAAFIALIGNNIFGWAAVCGAAVYQYRWARSVVRTR